MGKVHEMGMRAFWVWRAIRLLARLGYDFGLGFIYSTTDGVFSLFFVCRMVSITASTHCRYTPRYLVVEKTSYTTLMMTCAISRLQPHALLALDIH
jgi:hypothetical protein